MNKRKSRERVLLTLSESMYRELKTFAERGELAVASAARCLIKEALDERKLDERKRAQSTQ